MSLHVLEKSLFFWPSWENPCESMMKPGTPLGQVKNYREINRKNCTRKPSFCVAMDTGKIGGFTD